MNSNITRKNVGFFGWTYAQYLEKTHPEAWDRFAKREDHLDLLKKYHGYCQGRMTMFMEVLKMGSHIQSRNDLAPGLQQDFYDRIVYDAELKTIAGLIDLLQEASWMTEYDELMTQIIDTAVKMRDVFKKYM